jgi:hypothetical protein
LIIKCSVSAILQKYSVAVTRSEAECGCDKEYFQ